jgi:MoxR-like ATPase
MARRTLLPPEVGSPADLGRLLRTSGYLADTGVAHSCYLSLALQRPLFCEGEAGVGKTSLAHALADVLGAPLIRLQCYEGIDASQALYDWDFPRQLMHLRAAETAGRTGAEPTESLTPDALENELYSRRFLVSRPLLAALETTPAVLLVDEVDRADDEFEAFLLEILSDFTVTIPELGTVHAEVPPAVILTSNRTRDVHDALKRRCLYHWLDHPSFEREVEIVRTRLPQVSAELAGQVTAAVQALRKQPLLKPPGVAETLDWAEALLALGAERLEPEMATLTLGSVLKYHEDQQRIDRNNVSVLVSQALAGG